MYCEPFVEGDRVKIRDGVVEILSVKNQTLIDIVFIDTGFKTTTRGTCIRLGTIKDNMLPSVAGVGFLGGGVYSTRDKYVYQVWRDMLRRCYDKGSESYIKYGGRGITVSTEWHDFQNFANWYYSKKVKYTSDVKLEVDKDMFSDGTYSERSCTLVPQELNSLLTHDTHHKVGYCGVHYVKRINRYTSIAQGGHIGCHTDILEAVAHYKRYTEASFRDLGSKYEGQIDRRAYVYLMNYEYSNYYIL